MEFEIRIAKIEDLEEAAAITGYVWESLPNREWYVPDTLEKLKKLFIQKRITCYLAVEKEKNVAAGIFIVDKPGENRDNLGYDIGFSREERNKTVHMDSVAVLPEYRGQGLQKKMMHQAERDLRQQGICWLLCTVHPDNSYSLNNLLRQGYEIAATKKKYGGYWRHILQKKIL